MNFTEDLDELDRIWPLGKQLVIPDGGRVLVAGCYRGRYMDYVASQFFPKLVLGYEPQPEMARDAEQRLTRHECATVIQSGIGVHDCDVHMENWGTDGCRIGGLVCHPVSFTSVDSILDKHGPFDLFICNMEGYEIPLLSYLCGSGRISEIKSLAVQFHADNKRVAEMLTRHYGEPVYSDWPTWMYWRHTQSGRHK